MLVEPERNGIFPSVPARCQHRPHGSRTYDSSASPRGSLSRAASLLRNQPTVRQSVRKEHEEKRRGATKSSHEQREPEERSGPAVVREPIDSINFNRRYFPGQADTRRIPTPGSSSIELAQISPMHEEEPPARRASPRLATGINWKYEATTKPEQPTSSQIPRARTGASNV